MSERRSVIRFDDNGNALSRHNSIQEAQEIFRCTHISSVCSGKRKHDKGYVWRYEHEVERPLRHYCRRRRKRA